MGRAVCWWSEQWTRWRVSHGSYKTMYLFRVFGLNSKTATWKHCGKMNLGAEGPPYLWLLLAGLP